MRIDMEFVVSLVLFLSLHLPAGVAGIECGLGTVPNTRGDICVDVCSAAVPLYCAAKGADGSACTPGKGCNCVRGYANALDGSCVNTCGDCSPRGHTGFCDAEKTKKCVCEPNRAIGVKGTCVYGVKCLNTSACKEAKDTGTCFAGDMSDECFSCSGVLPNDLGKCEHPVQCGSGTLECVKSKSMTGTCKEEKCECNPGFINNDDGSCVDACSAKVPLDCAAKGADGSACTPGKGCNCVSGYANALDGSCVDTCGECVFDRSHAGHCDAEGTKKCICRTDYSVGRYGACFLGEECGATAQCTAPNHTGVCHAKGSEKCVGCPSNYPNDLGSCAPGVTCGTKGAVCVSGKSMTGTCKEGKCECNPGFINNDDGSCVDVCSAKVPLDCAAKGADGSACAPGKGCNCVSGYANALDGSCVDTCGECLGGRLCGGEGKCICPRGKAIGKKGTCVDGEVCDADARCTWEGDTGTCKTKGGIDCKSCTGSDVLNDKGVCVPGNECGSGASVVTCIAGDKYNGKCTSDIKPVCACNDGYVNAPDGTCVPGHVCGSGATAVTCIAGDKYNGKCATDITSVCACNDGYVNAPDGTCEVADPCKLVNCNKGDGYVGDCKVVERVATCSCAGGYRNGADKTSCELNCSSCPEGDAYDDNKCSKANGVLTCTCADGYKNTNPMTCDLDCSSCPKEIGYENGKCSEVDGALTCTCADGYSNPTARTCSVACGTGCTKADDDETKDKYTGACTTVGGVPSCVCTAGNKHKNDAPLVCETGNPCADVVCSSGTGYTGKCVQDRGFARCSCADGYVNDAKKLEMCTVNCAKCTDSSTTGKCSLNGNVVTCDCKDGYVKGINPLTCVEVTTTSTAATRTVFTTAGTAFIPGQSSVLFVLGVLLWVLID